MQLWDKILKAAILGSERTHFEPAVEDALRRYGIDPEDPLPQVILSGAATLHQLRRLELNLTSSGLPTPEPAPEEEESKPLPAQSLAQLQRILNGPYRRALPEFVHLMTDRQWALPPEFLPQLLDDSLQDADLWQSIRPTLGARAAWLIAQRPEWRPLLPQSDPADWAGAGFETRKLILVQIRQSGPEAAIPLLEEIWEVLHHRQKVDYLQILETGLNPADEAFLEKCREDSRKEVRRKAVDLLLSLPGSKLLDEQFAHLVPLFQLTTSGKLKAITLPDEIPDAALPEGLVSGKKGKSQSLKMDWLTESIARIPASYWQRQYKWNKEALVEAFGSSNLPTELTAALSQSALRFRDRELSVQLIRRLVLLHIPFPEGMDWQSIIKQVPAADMQEITETYLKQQAGLLEEQAPLTKILELGFHPWTKFTALRIINDLKLWMSESKTFLWNLWHYKRILEVAGYCSPVELFDTFNADWPMHSPVWNQWAPDVDRMLRTMRFRVNMYSPKN
jgi:hypothetical protein